MNLLLVINAIILIFIFLFLLWKKSYKLIFALSFLIICIGYLKYVYILKKEVITVAVIGSDYMPYSYMKNNKMKGIDITLLKEIIKKVMNKKLVFKYVEWNNLMNNDIEADIICGGLSSTGSRELNLHQKYPHLCFSTNYGPAVIAIVIRPNIKINEEFKGNIVLQKDSTFSEIAKSKFPNGTIILKDSFQSSIEEIKQGRADCIIGDALVLLNIFKNDFQDGYVIYKLKDNTTTNNNPKYTTFIVNSKKIDIDKFNTLLLIIQQTINNSEYKKLIKKLLELETI